MDEKRDILDKGFFSRNQSRVKSRRSIEVTIKSCTKKEIPNIKDMAQSIVSLIIDSKDKVNKIVNQEKKLG